MKIKCEHCKSLIDIKNQNKCYNCGAPYTNNKEYKEYLKKKELLEKENLENKLKTEKMAHDIINSTFTSFKITRIISLIIIVIVLMVFGIILFKGLATNSNISNNDTTEQDMDKTMSTFIFNSDLELFKGTQNGFFVSTLIDNVNNKNSKYKDHIISIKYDEKLYFLSNDLLKIKEKLNDNKEYNVLFDYDENGFIKLIKISIK